MSATSCTRSQAEAIRRGNGDTHIGDARSERARAVVDACVPTGTTAQCLRAGRVCRHRRYAQSTAVAVAATLLVGERIYPWPPQHGRAVVFRNCGM
ncbi:hypothetical protein [Lysobacter sp. CA196]|uniref:hypothetical protein n=1 Tax=Lysobacter sp. CA196 TaxID=3455606 RepID=UPI003F8D4D43